MTAPNLSTLVRSLASTALATALLAGCATAPADKTAKAPEPVTPTQVYAPTVTQAPEQVAFAVHPQGLSPNQKAALADFAGRWRDNGGGVMTLRTPVNSGVPALSRRTADAMSAYLVHLGVPADHMRLAGYDAGHAPNAPVLASFERYESVGPDCSQGWDNLTSTKNNTVSTHFGCAATANFAQMIANPRDLVVPSATDPADNSRREYVLGKYRQGAITSTSRDDQASGTVTQQ